MSRAVEPLCQASLAARQQRGRRRRQGAEAGWDFQLHLPALGRRRFRRSVRAWHCGRPGASLQVGARKLCRGVLWQSMAGQSTNGSEPPSHLIFTGAALKAQGTGRRHRSATSPYWKAAAAPCTAAAHQPTCARRR